MASVAFMRTALRHHDGCSLSTPFLYYKVEFEATISLDRWDSPTIICMCVCVCEGYQFNDKVNMGFELRGKTHEESNACESLYGKQ